MKHSKYGQSRQYTDGSNILKLKGGLPVSILVTICPFAVGVALMCLEGGILTLYWIIGTAILMCFTGLDLLWQRHRIR